MILDLRMPEIDGPTLYREVLTRWPAAASRVLFVSGLAELPHHDDTMCQHRW
jgi:FixJ family two-component response regulator